MIHVEKRIDELGITLPAAAAARANYSPTCYSSGNMLYISGKTVLFLIEFFPAEMTIDLDEILMPSFFDTSHRQDTCRSKLMAPSSQAELEKTAETR